jgi:hypothetical protein
MRRWLTALGAAVVVLLAMQLIRPTVPGATLPGDGTIGDHVDVPTDVDSLLRAACYDCHSDETRWPWYSHVAPLSWLIVEDVRHGRSNLDFSHWSTDPVREPTPTQRLRWMCDEVRKGIMPPLLYRVAHPEARLSEEEQDAICAWTRAALGTLRD